MERLKCKDCYHLEDGLCYAHPPRTDSSVDYFYRPSVEEDNFACGEIREMVSSITLPKPKEKERG